MQIAAVGFCVLFAIAIIVNVQLAGNALWFWYAVLLHRGVKLYADLHIVLQPLFVLEYNAWMRVAGVSCIGIEGLSFLHVCVLIAGIFLLLRESPWRDWQKGLVLAATFFVFIEFNAYLFNDYHITSDIFSLYSILLLLWLVRAETPRRQLVLSLLIGLLAGLSLTNRLNDGLALVVACGPCVFVSVHGRKGLLAGLALLTAALTILLVVWCTGDTFHTYLLNSVLHASGSKGGNGSVLSAPFKVIPNALHLLRTSSVKILGAIGLLFVLAAVVARKRPQWLRWIVAMQLALTALALVPLRHKVYSDTLVQSLSVLSVVMAYALFVVVVVRFARGLAGGARATWDGREIVLVLVFLLTAAGTGSTGGSARDFYSTLALLLVLVPVLEPFRGSAKWAYPTYLSIMILVLVGGVSTKVRRPYYWHNYNSSAMFTNRVWYRHPVYGPMYMERDAAAFFIPLCAEVRAHDTSASLQMLSLPYPYPNYFCNAVPWHGYVQTFFDTSPRATVEQLIGDLQTAPPRWIVYQRELAILKLHEEVYNHGQPLAQRDLDTLIMQKLASGEWTLISKRDYLEGDGWLLIETHR